LSYNKKNEQYDLIYLSAELTNLTKVIYDSVFYI